MNENKYRPDPLKERMMSLLRIGIVAGSSFLSSCNNESIHKDSLSPIETEQHEIVSSEAREAMTEGEFEDVWKNKLTELYDLIINHHSKYPDVTARYTELLDEINSRYKKELSMNIAINYSNLSQNVIAGSRVVDEEPQFALFVPTLRDIYEMKKADNEEGWEEEFQTLSLISAIHELDHIASGYVYDVNKSEASFEDRVEREKRAWALTCEYTIDPLVKRGVKIEYSDMLRYKAWVKAGKDVNSPIWEEAIRGIHSEIKGK